VRTDPANRSSQRAAARGGDTDGTSEGSFEHQMPSTAMGSPRLRVWELANQLGISTTEARARLEQLGWPTRTHASTVPPEAARPLREVTTPLPDLPQSPPTASWRSYLPLLKYVSRRRRGWAAIFLVTLASGLLSLLTPWPLKVLADQVLGHHPVTGWLRVIPGATNRDALITWIAVSSLAIFAAASGLEVLLTTSWVRTGQAMVYDVGADVLRRLQRRSVCYHNRQPVGDSMGRVMVDSHAVNLVAGSLLLEPLHALIVATGILLVLSHLELTLTMVALLTTPVMVLSTMAVGKAIRRAGWHRREAQIGVQSHLHQILSGIAVVQAFGQERRARTQFNELATTAVSTQGRVVVLGGINKLGSGLVEAIGSAVVLWIGADQVLSRRISVGALLVFLAYVRSLQSQLKVLSGLYATVQGARASLDRLVEVLSGQPEVVDHPGARRLPAVAGHLVMRDVTFGYGEGAPVLHEVSLEAKPGQTVAIVGPSGAGKTTLVSLVARFFDPWSGQVLLDGHDVRDVALADLRRQVSVVLQDSFLFPISIAENIAYGRPDASRSEIEEAARAANAHEFVVALPDGYDTVVGERGSTLSGGQRQRIAIARALLKDAPVLVLDEPTSSLDAASEHLLLEALERLMAGRTTLIIAHRLSTVRHADQIVVMEDGRVVEVGSHADLLALASLYATMHDLQNGKPRRNQQRPDMREKASR
jgi:ATP-binding cassette subfamily B protein